MRLALGWRVLLCATLGLVSPAIAQHSPFMQQNPVVVELFTSQGCAACPPADRLLDAMADREDVIALALHVDYWDYIGWADSFGQAQFSNRQKAYARAKGRSSVYTPQMIIGGIDEVKGSSRPQVMGTLGTHLSLAVTPDPVRITLSGERGKDVVIEARAPEGLPYAADVLFLRYKDAEKVEILAGENAGRSVTYRNIVTSLQVLGTWNGLRPFRQTLPAEGPEAVVVIIQEQGMGPIVGAARRR